MRKLTLLAAATFAATAVPAAATVTICQTANCAPTDENVLVTAATNQTTINGTTNNTGVPVVFTSSTDHLNGNANGQADVSATDGLLNDLTFALTGGNTFASATWNLFPLPGNANNEASSVIITYLDPLGHTQTLSINTNGQNFMGIFGNAGERFVSVEFTANPITTGIQDLRQLRLGGVAGPNGSPLPEPGTWGLMLLGFGAAGVAMRRNRRKELLTQAA
jgi:hypothetical protein